MSIDLEQIPSPCYVLEEHKLRRNLEILQRVQKEANIDIICALKGFAMFSAFPMLRQYLSGATASSLHEARLCFEEMKSEAHLCSPAYVESEFPDLMHYCSHITFNSINQWNRFAPLLQKSEKSINAALRINPEYSEVTTDIYNPCIAGSRLGVRREQLGNTLPEGINGLHFHSLCENDSYTLERTLQVIEKNFEDLLHQADWINMGGGHFITASGYDIPHLIQLLKKFKQKYDLQIILEPGGAIAYRTGFLVATVLDIIDSKGIKAVIMDASVSNHMPDCIEMPYKPEILHATNASEGQTAYRIGGMTCLAGDYVGDYAFEKPLQIGDKLLFKDMMQYTMVKTNTFNGINLPSIGIWNEQDGFRLVKRFGYDDYKSRLS